LKLKGAISFTSKSNDKLDKTKLMNMVVSKYVFKSVSNEKGWFICDSNVGNLSLKCEKFDKAIIHFLETININNFKIPDDYNLNSILPNYDHTEEPHKRESGWGVFKLSPGNKLLKLFVYRPISSKKL